MIRAEGESLVQDYATSNTYSVLIGMDNEGLESWKKGYITDQFYSQVLNTFQINDDKDGNHPQYQMIEELIYFEDWNKNWQLCVLDSHCIEGMSKVHNILTESAHGGHAKTYNHIAFTYYWPTMSPPATFAKRLNLEDTLQLDCSNLSLYHLSPLKGYLWILSQNYLHHPDSTTSWSLWINSLNMPFLFQLQSL